MFFSLDWSHWIGVLISNQRLLDGLVALARGNRAVHRLCRKVCPPNDLKHNSLASLLTCANNSVKWIGLFVTALVGLYTIEDLWNKFGDLRMSWVWLNYLFFRKNAAH